MVDYTLKFTNAYRIKESDEYLYDELKVKGDCKITNYDPANSDGKKRGLITIIFDYGDTTIKIGEGDRLSQDKPIADFSKKKYNILHEIASLSKKDKDTELTLDDIKNITEAHAKAWGIQKPDIDEQKGVATLVWGVGDMLRIDFETPEENKKVEEQDEDYDDYYCEPVKPVTTKKTTSPEKAVKINTNTNDSQISNDSTAFLDALGAKESGGEKEPYFCQNRYGYTGKYQMGEQALAQMGVYKKKNAPGKNQPNYNNDWSGVFIKNKYGITSLWDFRTSPEKQEILQRDYKRDEWRRIKSLKLDRFIGVEINGVEITESALLAGSHLVGIGWLEKYLKSNGEINHPDRNGKRVSDYIELFTGYDVSELLKPIL